jgi:electron transfer flavoprotein beta subunit
MNIIVLMKRVPDLVEDLEVDDTGKALDSEYLKLTLSEFDDHALEEALLLKESSGGAVTVLALEDEGVDKVLFTAMAKGADRALKISGASEVDGNMQLARVFAKVVGEQPFDLILTGVQAADDRDGQLAPIVAALLEIPCVEVVTGVTPSNGHISLHKEYAGGIVAEFEVDLPAMLGIQAARQTPRYAPVSKVRQVQEASTLEVVADASGATSSEFGVVMMTPPETGEGAQMLEDVDELLELLTSKGVIA